MSESNFREMCAELVDALENARRIIHGGDGTLHIDTAEPVLRRAYALLATQPPEPLRPIPVSERLPEANDCGHELCWMWESDINGHEDLGHWFLEHRNWASDPEADCTHWLPHNAIPFPGENP